jgi:hypothetical protein
MKRSLSYVLLALAVNGAWVSGAVAQNPYTPGLQPGSWPYPYPPYPGGYYPGAVGGALMGQADVIRASGDLMVQQQQARIVQQQAKQAALDTKKKSFEQMMWEKAHTATLTETLKYESGLQAARLMSSPTPAEITNAKTLNAMLDLIKGMAVKGAYGPPIPLDPYQLKQLNVTVGKEGINVGMLKEPKLTWPLCLQSARQKDKISTLLMTATSQAAMGALDAKLYKDLNVQIAAMNEDLRKQFHKEEIDGGEFLDGRRFIDGLTTNVKSLRDPTAQRMLEGSYAAKGRNVQELTSYMIQQGLAFAPANPGSEAAYQAIHDAFVAYTSAAQTSGGFHVQYMPPRAEEFK